ncbi:MAG: WG repeat-containing protein [Candidatus Gastranaerophilales bacterium]|nr:WG repeat-containing protein [Candidatus Gastranaerophilales bacterium]
MKKSIILLAFCLIISTNFAQAHHYHHSHCSSCVYVVRSENIQQEQTFKDCKKHSLLVDVRTNYYSNGSVRTFYSYDVLNEDGTILISNCSDVVHILKDKKHYFLAKKGKYYSIIDEKGNNIAKRKYLKMKEISSDKILVNVDKKFGIIDINENVVVPIKYKEFNQISQNLYLTKLNGYWGLLDENNNIFLKNEYDKIKPLYDTYIAKKEDKYTFLDINGKIILSDLDKIKKLGEYIIVKKDKKYGVFDYQGNQLSEIKYQKIKLERNNLKVYENKKWNDLL